LEKEKVEEQLQKALDLNVEAETNRRFELIKQKLEET
jgi:hypothetical protein